MKKLNINWDECTNILVLTLVRALSIILAGGDVVVLLILVFKARSNYIVLPILVYCVEQQAGLKLTKIYLPP